MKTHNINRLDYKSARGYNTNKSKFESFLAQAQTLSNGVETEYAKNLKKHTYFAKFTGTKQPEIGVIVFHNSEYFSTTKHTTYGHEFVSVYSQDKDNSLFIDQKKFEVVTELDYDFVICKISVVLKNFRQLKTVNQPGETCMVTPFGVIPLNIKTDMSLANKTYSKHGLDFKFSSNDLAYNVTLAGLCGSPILRGGKIIGHHVAGNENIGVARIFDYPIYSYGKSAPETRDIITREDMSVQFLGNQFTQQHIPTSSRYSESEVYGQYPMDRKPANLTSFGRETIHEMAKKSWAVTKPVRSDALEFSISLVEQIIPQKIRKLTEKETILGFNNLGPIDKDTSCGYGFNKRKVDYIDFERGVFKEDFREVLESKIQIIKDLKNDENTFVFKELLKDELRDLEKVDKPRCFKSCPLDYTVLVRQSLGDLVDKIFVDRFSNGIMVGINPLGPDWNKFYDDMSNFSAFGFDGDWGSWDGGMLQPFQEALVDVISKRTSEEIFVKTLLQYIINTPTITEASSYITTHSTPSGHPLTAIFNSLINKMYTAYIYYLWKLSIGEIPELTQFNMNVRDYVYGDDKIVLVRERDKNFNGAVMSEFAQQMGLKFTPADKTDWTLDNKLVSVRNLQFLKRGFRYHNVLQQIVAPLSKKSILSTLNFVTNQVEVRNFTIDKLYNAQRELYLHEDYETLSKVEQSLKNLGQMPLTNAYLVKLYNSGNYASLLQPQSGNNEIRLKLETRKYCKCVKCTYSKNPVHELCQMIYRGKDEKQVLDVLKEISKDYNQDLRSIKYFLSQHPSDRLQPDSIFKIREA
uniref:RdRp catalytic domain-containing protein n=1 Tax=Trichosanthes kirilowii picorna-like virus TaxID=2739857 RepID=A0A6M9BK90_9VIRU|nr:hypothetical protein 1 [Trichosanthes kirilowii picorna-like virus]